MTDENENDDAEFGFSDETDLTIEQLRIEVLRLQMQSDQLAAASREMAIQMKAIQAQNEQFDRDYRELGRQIDELIARRKRAERMIWVKVLICAGIGTAIGQLVAALLF